MNPQRPVRNPGHVSFNQDQLSVVDKITEMTGLRVSQSAWLGLRLLRDVARQAKTGKAGWASPAFKLFPKGQPVRVWVGDLPTRSSAFWLLIFGVIVGAFILGVVVGVNHSTG